MDLFVLRAVLGLDKSEYDEGIKDAKDSAQDAGGGIGGALGAAAKVGAAALKATATAAFDFGKSAIEAGQSFDASMSNVAAISGASGADFDDLRDKAQQMGATTKFSATEAADAFGYMAMAGWKTEQMLGGIEGIMNLAAASGEDLATTSDIVTDALTAFGLKAEDATHFADILAVASSNANTNVSMMGETFKYVAPVAGSMGYSAEDMAESIGLMANAGIKSTQAGTSLRSIITRLATDAGATTKKLGALGTLTEELGVQFYKADGTTRDFNDVIVDARKAWQGLTDEQQANYAKTIAGQNAISGWLALMNAGSEDVNKLHDSIEHCDGAAEDMAATMQDNLAGDIKIFESAVEGAQIALSDELTPTLREFVQYGSGAIGTLTEAFRNGGLEGLMAELGGVVSEGLALVIEKLPEVLEAGTGVVLALVQGIVENIPALGDAAVQVVSTLATQLYHALPNLIPSAVSAITQLATTLTAPDTLRQLAVAALDIIDGLGQGIINSLPNLREAAAQIVQNLQTFVTENLPNLLYAVSYLGEQLVGGLLSSMSESAEQAPEIWNALQVALMDALPQFLDTAAELVGTLAQGITDALPILAEVALEMFSNIKNNIDEKLPDIIDSAVGLVAQLVVGIEQALPVLLEQAPVIISSLLDTMLHEIPMLIEAASRIIGVLVQGIADTLPDLIAAVPQIIAAIVTTLAENLPEILTAGVNLILELVAGILEGLPKIAEAIGQVVSEITGGLADLPGKALQWGKDMMENLSNGIKGAVGNVKDAAVGVGKKIKNFLGFSEPEEGPLSDFHTYAPDMMKLFAKGIKDNETLITDQMGRSFDIGPSFTKGASTSGEDTISELRSYMEDMLGQLTEGLQECTQRIAEQGEDLLSNLNGYARDMLSQISDGLRECASTIVKEIDSALSAMVPGTAKGASGVSGGDASSFITETLAAINDAMQRLFPVINTVAVGHNTEMFANTQATISSAEKAADLLRGELFSNTEATFYAGEAAANTISGSITTYADMMLEAMGEILAEVRICSHKSNEAAMEMDGVRFARVFLPYIDREQQRVGVRLSTGGAV